MRHDDGRGTVSEQLDKGNGRATGQGSGHNPGIADGQPSETKATRTRSRVGTTSARPPKVPALTRRLYDLKAIAEYLGLPVYSVRGLIWNGSLPCVRIGRRQYLDIKDVDALIELNKSREE